MLKRTFIDKTNTIFKGSKDNFGLYPIIMLTYGDSISRALVKFNVDDIIKEYGRDQIIKENGVTHRLKMTNCGSLDKRNFHKEMPYGDLNSTKKRATSFDLIAFRVPMHNWDQGVGFDDSYDMWLVGESATSQEGSNWYQAYNGRTWLYNNEEVEGILPISVLKEEIEKFNNNEESLIISRQHFDYGNENIDLDITSYIKGVAEEKYENTGICIAFSPRYEETTTLCTQYVGFFNDETNTFFHPVVESRSVDVVSDERMNFVLGKENKLFFFFNVKNAKEPADLDEIPVCTIDEVSYPVERLRAGVYYANVLLPESYEEGQICYDVWSNLIYKGRTLKEVEMSFVTKEENIIYNFSIEPSTPTAVVPSLSGLNDNQNLLPGESKLIKVIFRIPYTSDSYTIKENAKYRIYVKDGKNELTVVDWTTMDKYATFNAFMLKGDEYVPNTYYVDIMYVDAPETRVFKNKLIFTIPSDTSKRKI